MLTGEVAPTAGYFQIYGRDVRTSWSEARGLVGLCPQGSILPPHMTLAEVVMYYCLMKGTGRKDAPSEVDRTISSTGLQSHRDYLVTNLSEGLKRRLSLAIAFVGGSKLVILDEPTSGVDPTARHAIWEVISQHRANRTILLTTHHLDEAETLADRVAILHQGRLLCVGSPLALKTEYGSGYTLTLAVKTVKIFSPPRVGSPFYPTGGVAPTQTVESRLVNNANHSNDELWRLLIDHAPNVRLLEAINDRLVYSIPDKDLDGSDNNLSGLFKQLEIQSEGLGYNCLEIRPTSLEDVVITLGGNDGDKSRAASALQNKTSHLLDVDINGNFF